MVSLCLGAALLSINLFGLSQSIRKPGLGVTDHFQLRFVPEKVQSYEESIDAIEKLSALLTNNELAEQANKVTHHSLVHIDWPRVDPVEYRQLIPIWENYFLYTLGKHSGLPQFERYHYADYKRNIRRGIGICGDASTVLSSILDIYSIPNQIVSFQGHVIVEYTDEDGNQLLLDPDFGVSLGLTLEELVNNPESARAVYTKAGYRKAEVDYLLGIYYRKYAYFDDTYQFMTKRYIFEDTSYTLKWILPILLLLLSALYLYRNHKVKNTLKKDNHKDFAR